MSKYNLIRGEAFIYGECIFVIEDSGFTNVEQVITRLLSSLHEDVPRPTKVQNKPAAAVAICRRGGATAAYQTMNMIFEMMNMPVVTSQYWNIAHRGYADHANLGKQYGLVAEEDSRQW